MLYSLSKKKKITKHQRCHINWFCIRASCIKTVVCLQFNTKEGNNFLKISLNFSCKMFRGNVFCYLSKKAHATALFI